MVIGHPQHGGILQSWQQSLSHSRLVRDQPNPVEPVFVLAQALAQLALQIQLARTGRITGASRHAEQQPLAFQVSQTASLGVQAARGDGRQRSLGLDEFAKNPAPLRTHHIVGEVRNQHWRSAGQQQGKHGPATPQHPPRPRHGIAGQWQGMHCQTQGLFSRGLGGV